MLCVWCVFGVLEVGLTVTVKPSKLFSLGGKLTLWIIAGCALYKKLVKMHECILFFLCKTGGRGGNGSGRNHYKSGSMWRCTISICLAYHTSRWSRNKRDRESLEGFGDQCSLLITKPNPKIHLVGIFVKVEEFKWNRGLMTFWTMFWDWWISVHRGSKWGQSWHSV